MCSTLCSNIGNGIFEIVSIEKGKEENLICHNGKFVWTASTKITVGVIPFIKYVKLCENSSEAHQKTTAFDR